MICCDSRYGQPDTLSRSGHQNFAQMLLGVARAARKTLGVNSESSPEHPVTVGNSAEGTEHDGDEISQRLVNTAAETGTEDQYSPEIEQDSEDDEGSKEVQDPQDEQYSEEEQNLDREEHYENEQSSGDDEMPEDEQGSVDVNRTHNSNEAKPTFAQVFAHGSLPQDTGPYKFHKDSPKFLSIGKDKADGNTIYLRRSERIVTKPNPRHISSGRHSRQTNFCKEDQKRIKEDSLDIIWHYHLRLKNFAGAKAAEKETNRKRYCDWVIRTKAALVRPEATGPSMVVKWRYTPRATGSKKRRRYASRALSASTALPNETLEDSPPPPAKKQKHAGEQSSSIEAAMTPGSGSQIESDLDEDQDDVAVAKQDKAPQPRVPTKPQLLSPAMLKYTFLHVSRDDLPAQAPVALMLEDYDSLDQLFSTMLVECDLLEEAAREVTRISATYAWNGHRLLLRKGKEGDWRIFCGDVFRAWANDNDFLEEPCRIGLVIHTQRPALRLKGSSQHPI